MNGGISEIACGLPRGLASVIRLHDGEPTPYLRARRLVDAFEWTYKWHAILPIADLLRQKHVRSSFRSLLASALRAPAPGVWQILFQKAVDALDRPAVLWREWDTLTRLSEQHDILAFRNLVANGARPSDASCLEYCERLDPVMLELLRTSFFHSVSLTTSADTGHAVAVLPSGERLDLWPFILIEEGETFLFNALRSGMVEHRCYAPWRIRRDAQLWSVVRERFASPRHDHLHVDEFRARIEALTEHFKGRIAERRRLHEFCRSGNGTFMVWGLPGIGKSSVFAQLIRELEAGMDEEGAESTATPQFFDYFIRRGTTTAQPETFLRYVCSRLDETFDLRGFAIGATLGELADLLERRLAAVESLVRTRRVVLLIDGLDEGDAVAQFIPHPRPWLVVIVSSRRVEAVESFYQSREPDRRAFMDIGPLNTEDVRALLADTADPYDPAFDDRWVDAVRARAEGNPLYVILLCNQLYARKLAIGDHERLPDEMGELFDATAARISSGDHSLSLDILTLLAEARSALPLSSIAEFLGVAEDVARAALMRCKEVLFDHSLDAGIVEYQLFHERLREWLRRAQQSRCRSMALRLANGAMAWERLGPTARRYALRHGLSHIADASGADAVWELIEDEDYRRAQIDELGSHDASFAALRTAIEVFSSPETPSDDRLCWLALRSAELLREARADAATVFDLLQRRAISAADALLRIAVLEGPRFTLAALTILYCELQKNSKTIVETAEGVREAILGRGSTFGGRAHGVDHRFASWLYGHSALHDARLKTVPIVVNDGDAAPPPEVGAVQHAANGDHRAAFAAARDDASASALAIHYATQMNAGYVGMALGNIGAIADKCHTSSHAATYFLEAGRHAEAMSILLEGLRDVWSELPPSERFTRALWTDAVVSAVWSGWVALGEVTRRSAITDLRRIPMNWRAPALCGAIETAARNGDTAAVDDFVRAGTSILQEHRAVSELRLHARAAAAALRAERNTMTMDVFVSQALRAAEARRNVSTPFLRRFDRFLPWRLRWRLPQIPSAKLDLGDIPAVVDLLQAASKRNRSDILTRVLEALTPLNLPYVVAGTRELRHLQLTAFPCRAEFVDLAFVQCAMQADHGRRMAAMEEVLSRERPMTIDLDWLCDLIAVRLGAQSVRKVLAIASESYAEPITIAWAGMAIEQPGMTSALVRQFCDGTERRLRFGWNASVAWEPVFRDFGHVIALLGRSATAEARIALPLAVQAACGLLANGVMDTTYGFASGVPDEARNVAKLVAIFGELDELERLIAASTEAPVQEELAFIAARTAVSSGRHELAESWLRKAPSSDGIWPSSQSEQYVLRKAMCHLRMGNVLDAARCVASRLVEVSSESSNVCVFGTALVDELIDPASVRVPWALNANQDLNLRMALAQSRAAEGDWTAFEEAFFDPAASEDTRRKIHEVWTKRAREQMESSVRFGQILRAVSSAGMDATELVVDFIAARVREGKFELLARMSERLPAYGVDAFLASALPSYRTERRATAADRASLDRIVQHLKEYLEGGVLMELKEAAALAAKLRVACDTKATRRFNRAVLTGQVEEVIAATRKAGAEDIAFFCSQIHVLATMMFPKNYERELLQLLVRKWQRMRESNYFRVQSEGKTFAVGRRSSRRHRLFFSYAHADERFLRALLKHLKPFVREGLIETWNDEQILAGDSWSELIEEQMNAASVFILLVSPDYLDSDYCGRELETALDMRRQRVVRVIPIIVRPCAWRHTDIGTLQVISNKQAVSQATNEDAAWHEVVTDLARALTVDRVSG